jgi:dipeptidyl aminopeptidase/acylaminoacyl peptidase
MMTDHSGIYHIENATAPTLMFHGAQDPRMPISQSFQLHYALKTRGIPVRFLTFPGSGHIPGDPNQILAVWDETLKWLTEKNQMAVTAV